MKSETKYILFVGVLLILVIGGFFYLNYNFQKPTQSGGELKRFESLEEIKNFLKDNSLQDRYMYGTQTFSERTLDSVASEAVAGEQASSADEFSGTNIQVEGVDEPDIVKNDGKYIYAVSGKKVIVVDAFPAEEMEILNEMDFDNNVNNIFINDDKLIVFSSRYEYFETGVGCGDFYDIGITRCGGYSRESTLVFVYDISDKQNIKLKNEYEIAGNYVDARMIDNFVYLISSKYVYLNNFELPSYKVNGVDEELIAKEVYYFDSPDSRYIFNSVNAIDLESGELNKEIYLMGYSNSLYFSEDNLYITYRKQVGQEYYFELFVDEVILPNFENNRDVREIINSDDSKEKKMNSLREFIREYANELEQDELEEFLIRIEEDINLFYEKISKESDKTIIHKISVDGLDIEYSGKGEVPGSVLNQFSMDENDGYFRIATTTSEFSREQSENNLYVLDSDLKIIGSVEGLAEGERIYSVRFLGDKAYMVTFRQVDPLYVIDLSDVENPEVLGFLKVTGYSGYLHPYDSEHIIGVGMEANVEGRTSGVKIALFDVSDFENPEEVGKYVVEGRWSYSDALYDHKAFLFDKSRELLVIPVSYTEEIQSNGLYPNYEYWQGAYVLNINLEGISLRGKIQHRLEETEDFWYRSEVYVRRALFMDNILYTVSDRKVKANLLSDLSDINEVEIPFEEIVVR